MAESPPVAGMRSKVAAELAMYVRPITDATLHPDNSRKHDLPSIARSLNKHGQHSLVLVQASTGFIVKGNGTWTAAAQILGWDHLAMQWQEMNDEEALGLLLADNKASDGAGYDGKKLTAALSKMMDGPGLLDTLWTDAEFEDLVEDNSDPVILDAQASDAAFADAAYAGERAAAGEEAAPRGKMKEVPLVLTMQDHADFVARVAKLKLRFGMTGNVATVVEAIRRQAAAEEDAVEVGRKLGDEAAAAVLLQFVRQLAARIRTAPARFSAERMLEELAETESELLPKAPVKRQEPGQLGAFEADSATTEAEG